MKKYLLPSAPTAFLPIASLFCGLALPSVASADTFDFSSSAQFTNGFTVIDSGAAGTTSYSTDAGIGGVAGRVNLSGIGTSSGEGLYTTGQVDPDDGAFSVSFFFLAESFVDNDAFSRIALGLSPDQSNLRAASEVQVRLIKDEAGDATFEVRDSKNDSSGDNISTSNVTLLDDHWYQFSVDFSNYGSGSMNLSASLVDFGTSGTIAGTTIATAKAGRTVPGDFLDTSDRLPLYIGILAQNDGGGALALDNINVPFTAIPEPSMFSLVAVVGVFSIVMNRRRSAKR